MKYEAIVIVLLILILLVVFAPEAYRRWVKSSREDEREGIENERLRRELDRAHPTTSQEETGHRRHVDPDEEDRG